MAKSKTNGSPSANNGTLVTFLLDKSGSMQGIYDATIEAFNAYLDGMRGESRIEFSLVQFDSTGLEKTCVKVPIKDAPPLGRENYKPHASTPLIDAAVKTIRAVEKDVVERKKKPQVVICIQTDGQENCSTEFTWADLNALIKEKTAEGWQFNFMGAGIDAYDQGAKMGLSAASTMSYNSADLHATRSAFIGRSKTTALYASGAVSDMSISSDEKSAAGDAWDPDTKNNKKPSQQPQHTITTTRRTPSTPIVDDFTL